jgi:hypothetical protein
VNPMHAREEHRRPQLRDLVCRVVIPDSEAGYDDQGRPYMRRGYDKVCLKPMPCEDHP